MNKIAIIVGRGIQFGKQLENQKELYLNTPYGKPSSVVLTGKLDGQELVVIHRHGHKEETPAFQVNYKANLFSLYDLKCTHLLATSLCGSLQEEIEVGEFVVFDQFIDLTNHRELTFDGNIELNSLNHSAFHKPFSDEIRNSLIESAVQNGVTIHTKGTILAVDGPRQSTRAESNLFRHWGADVINTTTAPEAILAHELGIQYGALSLCTYYDTWRTDIAPATRTEKQDVIDENSQKMMDLILASLSKIVGMD